MANNNDSSSQTHDSLPGNKKLAMREKKKPSYDLPILSLVSILITLFAIVFALFSLYQVEQLKAQVKKDRNQFINTQQKTTDSLKEVLRLKEQLSATTAQMDNKLETVQKEIAHALKQRFYQQQDWLLLKAKNYLELAQVNGYWGEDRAATIALLQAADHILKDIHNPEIFSIRQTLAQEMSTIKNLPLVDQAGLLSRVDALNTSIAQLPTKQFSTSKLNTSSSEESWQSEIAKNLQQLNKLVIIRRYDTDVQPLFSPFYQALIRENLSMELKQASFAVLQRNQEIFNLSLQQAQNTIERNYDMQSELTEHFLSEIQALRALNIANQPLPIKHSLEMLNQLIDKESSNSSLGGES